MCYRLTAHKIHMLFSPNDERSFTAGVEKCFCRKNYCLFTKDQNNLEPVIAGPMFMPKTDAQCTRAELKHLSRYTIPLF